MISHQRFASLSLILLKADPTEMKNLASAHPEKTDTLQKQIIEMIIKGRTIPGAAQPNDTGYWQGLTWMKASDFKD